MNIDLFIISILEGLTEFLPVSSTAHIIITAKLLALDLAEPYIKFYFVFIQLGALCAGIFLFAKKIFSDKKIFLNLCISFLPSGALGFVFYKLFKHLLEGNMLLMATMLALGGVIFIYLEKVFMQRDGVSTIENFGKSEISKTDALLVGVAQALAIIPGVSRSGITIIAGVLRGIKNRSSLNTLFCSHSPHSVLLYSTMHINREPCSRPSILIKNFSPDLQFRSLSGVLPFIF